MTSMFLLLAACDAVNAPTTSSVARTGGAGRSDCVSPLDYGAIVDDNTDDRVATQAAIDAACDQNRAVCLPAGQLDFSRTEGTGVSHAFSLAVSCDGLLIYGDGDASRLSMMGAAQVGMMTGPGDWWLVKIDGSNITVRDAWLDGTARSQPTSEQTHLIKVLGPARDVVLENLRMTLPDAGPSTGGDCIQAGGEQATPVRGLTVDKVRADACDRSFVGLQREVYGVSIVNSSSEIVGDQVLDEEPTGVGTISDVTVRNCRFRRNGLGNGVALTITGGAGGAAPGSDHLIEHTQIDGSVLIYKSGRATLRDLTIVSSGTAPTIDVKNASSDISIENVYAEHGAGGTAAVVNLGIHTGAWPSGVKITRSHFIQRAEGDVIHAEPVAGLTVSDTDLECLGPVANTYAAIMLRAVSAPITNARVANVVAQGNCRYLVRAARTSGFGVAAVNVSGSIFTGGAYGVYFENGAPTVKPVVSGNQFADIPVSTNQVVGAGSAGFVGSNAP